MSTTLELPSHRWSDSYRALVEEFNQRGEPLIPAPLKVAHEDFAAFLTTLRNAAQWIALPEGKVPYTTYWLIENDVEVVAVASLRHELNEALRFDGGHIGYGVRPSARRRGHATRILAESLLAAAKLGIDRCLVTCRQDNLGSARAIQRNGGVLESEVWSPTYHGIVQRYWIDGPRREAKTAGAS